jgi:protein farnesyltransferase subunit beta
MRAASKAAFAALMVPVSSGGGGDGWLDAQRWAVARQMRLEGGFQGRTNKLVDGCYSFWVGGVFPLLRDLLRDAG